jgi:hypothetical protein
LLLLKAEAEHLPGLLRTFQLKNEAEVLQFQSAEAAEYALKELKQVADLCDLDRRKIAPWCPSWQLQQTAAFELRITLERRELQDSAIVQFSTEEEVKELPTILRDVEISPTSSYTLCVRKDIKNDDKRPPSCKLIIHGSPKVTDESLLLKALQTKGLNPVGVSFLREPAYESSLDVQQEVAERIGKVFTDSRTCSEGEFRVDLKKAYPKDFHWSAWLRFQSSSAGLRCAKYCEVTDTKRYTYSTVYGPVMGIFNLKLN